MGILFDLETDGFAMVKRGTKDDVVECFFYSIKRWRRIATRYEKTATSYLGLLHLACALLWIQ